MSIVEDAETHVDTKLESLAPGRGPQFTGPVITIDPWSVWRATTPPLQRVLKRDGAHIRCPELNTQYPAAPDTDAGRF